MAIEFTETTGHFLGIYSPNRLIESVVMVRDADGEIIAGPITDSSTFLYINSNPDRIVINKLLPTANGVRLTTETDPETEIIPLTFGEYEVVGTNVVTPPYHIGVNPKQKLIDKFTVK